jgi:hypothetical protein
MREQLMKLAKFKIRDVESEPSRARVILAVFADELQAVQNAADESRRVPPCLLQVPIPNSW